MQSCYLIIWPFITHINPRYFSSVKPCSLCVSLNTREAVRLIKSTQEGRSDNTADTGSSSDIIIKHYGIVLLMFSTIAGWKLIFNSVYLTTLSDLLFPAVSVNNLNWKVSTQLVYCDLEELRSQLGLKMKPF